MYVFGLLAYPPALGWAALTAVAFGSAMAWLKVEWVTLRGFDSDSLSLAFCLGCLVEAALTACGVALTGELYWDAHGLLAGVLIGGALLLWVRLIQAGAGLALSQLAVAAGALVAATAVQQLVSGGTLGVAHLVGLTIVACGVLLAVGGATGCAFGLINGLLDETEHEQLGLHPAERVATQWRQPLFRPMAGCILVGVLLGLMPLPHLLSPSRVLAASPWSCDLGSHTK